MKNLRLRIRSIELICLGVTALLLAQDASADPKAFFHNRYLQNKLQVTERMDPFGSLLSAFPRIARPGRGTESHLFDQKVNHADPTDTRTFKQRYYLNSDYASAPDAPVLFYICGEAACEAGDLRGAVLAYGKKYGAHLVALEHRYYGKSQPFPTLSAENLKFLSTDQALNDLANFQRFARQAHPLKGKWVSVGGSYPGSLSAYYRQKFPDLIEGALASSAPVRAKENFEEYDLHVATVAGEACAAAMREAVAQVESVLMDPVKLAETKKLFGSEDVRETIDFLYVVADMGAIAIQYGYKTEFCNELLFGRDVLVSYAKAGLEMFRRFGITPLEDSFQGAESEDPESYMGSFGMRQWFYQSCTEYGYFQNAYHDPAISVRSGLISPAYHASVCQRLFGLSAGVPEAATNVSFYEPLLDASTSGILFTNGSTDPWSKLSITRENGNDVNPRTQTYTIDGAAHCDDLRAPRPTDSASLKQSREMFEALLKTWWR